MADLKDSAGIVGHLAHAKKIMWDQLEATSRTLETSEEPHVRRAFNRTQDRLQRLLKMHRACLETRRTLDIAQAGLLLERKEFGDKVERIQVLCDEIVRDDKDGVVQDDDIEEERNDAAVGEAIQKIFQKLDEHKFFPEGEASFSSR
mmetsp:Transcript_24368/g.47718  ORF Transcript_24368/g.47718 Transcript_24368/m.47718 type:complete len:147 (-) Transcript_24368:103-543(-)